MMIQSPFEIRSSPAGKTIRNHRDKRQLLARRLKEVVYGKRPAVKVFSQTLQKHLWVINEALADPRRYEEDTVTLENLVEIINQESEDRSQKSGETGAILNS
jgi:hypothetical protein